MGIDCGGEYTGFGVVEMYDSGKLCCLTCGAIKLSPREAYPASSPNWGRLFLSISPMKLPLRTSSTPST
jgi:hypothetical protein